MVAVKVRLSVLTIATFSFALDTDTVTVPAGRIAGCTVKVPLSPSLTVSSVGLTVRTGRLALIVNVSVSASLAAVLSSASVTFHVHVVGPHAVLGVPLSRLVARSNVTPPGR